MISENAVGTDRRSFLSRAAGSFLSSRCLLSAGALFGSRAFGQGPVSSSGGDADSATSMISGDLASTAGASLGNALAGQVASFAIGQILLSEGSGGQAATDAKLNQIINMLTALQMSVDQLSSDMKSMLSQMSYDAAVAPVQLIITRNAILMGMYRDITQASTPTEMARRKTTFRNKLYSYDLELDFLTWNDALRGLNSTTGIIVAWSRAVYASYPLFGPTASTAIQSHRSRFDAEQSRTVMFLVEYLNGLDGERYRIPEILDRWRTNRRQQLQMLRGMPPGFTDKFSRTTAPITPSCWNRRLLNGSHRTSLSTQGAGSCGAWKFVERLTERVVARSSIQL